MKRIALALLMVLSGWLVSAGSHQEAPPLALTLYSDLGLLEEEYALNAVKGEQIYSIVPVPHTLIPDSVVFRTPGETFRIFEQEFLPAQRAHSAEFLKSSIGQEIEVTVARALVPKTYRGVLLSTEDGIVLQEPSGRVQILRDYSEIALAKLPDYRPAPVLRWRAYSETEGVVTGQLSYLVDGLRWSAHYTAILNETEDQFKLSSWVVIGNQSGRDYPHARLTLIAGELRRVTPPPPPVIPMAQRLEKAAASEAPVETKPAFEYHEYKLTRPTTLKDQQTLQLSFLEAPAVRVSKHYVYEAARSPEQVRVEIRLLNDAAHGLGIALPAGVVRLYKIVANGRSPLRFIGEDALEHTPKNEKIALVAGMVFDLKAERVLKDRQVVGRDEFGRETYRETYEIKLRNQKENDVTIEVQERLQGTWKMISSEPSYEKLDAYTVLFKAPVKAQGTATVTYTVEWRY
jgi:hypothetical protein